MEMIRLRLGMSLLDVESNNHVRLELAKLRDDSPVVIEKPVHIGYFGPRGAFDLPPTLTIWISQYAGTVVSLKWAPQLEALRLSAVRALAADTVATIESAGWQAQRKSPRPVPSVAELEEQFSRLESGGLFSRELGDWQIDNTTLSLSLKELVGEGSDSVVPLSRRRFLLNLYISDPAVRDAHRKAMIARRRHTGGGENDALPLSAWIGAR